MTGGTGATRQVRLSLAGLVSLTIVVSLVYLIKLVIVGIPFIGDKMAKWANNDKIGKMAKPVGSGAVRRRNRPIRKLIRAVKTARPKTR